MRLQVLKAVTLTRRNPKTRIMISLFLNRYSLSENRVIRERKPNKSSSATDQKSDYFAFSTESQNRDHEFFERLSGKDAERELKS